MARPTTIADLVVRDCDELEVTLRRPAADDLGQGVRQPLLLQTATGINTSKQKAAEKLQGVIPRQRDVCPSLPRRVIFQEHTNLGVN